MARLLRTGRDYLGSWVRLSAGLAGAERATALRRYLASTPER